MPEQSRTCTTTSREALLLGDTRLQQKLSSNREMLDVLHTSTHVLCRALAPQSSVSRQKLHLTQFRCQAHLTQLVQQGDAAPARRAAALVAPVLQAAKQTHRSAARLHGVVAYNMVASSWLASKWTSKRHTCVHWLTSGRDTTVTPACRTTCGAAWQASKIVGKPDRNPLGAGASSHALARHLLTGRRHAAHDWTRQPNRYEPNEPPVSWPAQQAAERPGSCDTEASGKEVPKTSTAARRKLPLLAVSCPTPKLS